MIVEDQSLSNTRAQLLTFDETHYHYSAEDVATLSFEQAPGKYQWLHIEGLQDQVGIQALGQRCDLHPLIIEDILNTTQRLKVEVFDKVVYIVAKACHLDEAGKMQFEQISLILLGNRLISIQESHHPYFAELGHRLVVPKTKLRTIGVNHLLYALLDRIVDDYVDFIEAKGDQLEDLETELIENPNRLSLRELYLLKRENIALRRVLSPLRDMLGAMLKENYNFIQGEDHWYWRDLYDHSLRALATLDIYRDTTASMLDIYLSSVNNKMNDTMRILTIFASIFIPLTFLSSLYGMNFEHMPELKWHYGYYALLGIMSFIALMMLWFFKRKKWL